MDLNFPEVVYLYLHTYALWIGVGGLVLGLLVHLIFRKKRAAQKVFTVVIPLILVIAGAYLILWNFRIINVPYRDPDTSAATTAEDLQENKDNAHLVTFKTFKPTYTPDYVASRTSILSVFLDIDNQPQFDLGYHKYLTGLYLNSDIINISETVASGDITQSKSRSNDCDYVHELSGFQVIGKNAAGGDVFKATSLPDVYYLTDIGGTRIELQHCHLLEQAVELTDTDAVKILGSLKAFNINTADFTEHRK